MLLLLLFNKAKDAFVILKLLQIRVANEYEKHTESNMREVEELLGWIVKEKIKTSKTLFLRLLMITQHEKAVAAKLNDLVNTQTQAMKGENHLL